MTTSADPSTIGPSTLGISAGSCCPSPSRVTTTSGLSFEASRKRVLRAEPLPIVRECLNTIAPIDNASSEVSSEDPSSHTNTNSEYLLASFTTGPIAPASLSAGMQTITDTWGALTRSSSCLEGSTVMTSVNSNLGLDGLDYSLTDFGI